MDKILNKFKALSDETRLKIMNLFIKSDRDLCVCELMDALSLRQYTISKALMILKNAGFFKTEKDGTWVYYRLNKDIPENKSIFNFLKNYLNSKVSFEVESRLNNRLLLREKEKCVVGIIPEEDLIKLIKEKSKE